MIEVKLNPASRLNVDNVYEPLFNFYLTDKSIDADTPYDLIESKAKVFLEHIDSELQMRISKSIYSPNNDLFQFGGPVTEYEKYGWLYGFQNFYRAVNNIIKKHKHSEIKQEGAHAQYVLGKDAFKYVGHNSMNVARSKRGYASLFHH